MTEIKPRPELNGQSAVLDLIDQAVEKYSHNLMTFPSDDEIRDLQEKLDYATANSPAWSEQERVKADTTITKTRKYLADLQKREGNRSRLHERDMKLAEVNSREPFTEEDRNEASAIIKEYESE